MTGKIFSFRNSSTALRQSILRFERRTLRQLKSKIDMILWGLGQEPSWASMGLYDDETWQKILLGNTEIDTKTFKQKQKPNSCFDNQGKGLLKRIL